MTLRASKLMLVLGVALYYSLVVFNNTTDYNSNYQLVRHVLMMDSTFPGNHGMWRAMNSPVWHTVFYFSVIAWESTTMVLAWWGGIRLARALRGPAAVFNQAKKLAIAALTLGLLMWRRVRGTISPRGNPPCTFGWLFGLSHWHTQQPCSPGAFRVPQPAPRSPQHCLGRCLVLVLVECSSIDGRASEVDCSFLVAHSRCRDLREMQENGIRLVTLHFERLTSPDFCTVYVQKIKAPSRRPCLCG